MASVTKPTTERCKVTPRQLAASWGISISKVLGWIRTGELHAINAATRQDGSSPRFLIDVDDIAAFEAARSVVTKPVAKTPRRRRPPNVKQYV